MKLNTRIILIIVVAIAFYLILFITWAKFPVLIPEVRDQESAARRIVTNITKTPGWKVNFEYVVVHLDLKGAPPTLSFLTSLLPMIKHRGANAILMEYEDMFPYDGSLVSLSNPNCYNKEQLIHFLTVAQRLDIEVIPLVQTFGHMEYVLKLQEFQHLREEPQYPDSICPSKNSTLTLIENMLKQVTNFHNRIHPLKHIHIGCDEVNLSEHCSDCKARKKLSTTIMLEHVTTVIDIVRKLSPGITPLMWDDMWRFIKPITWERLKKKSHLKNAEPVYWLYEPEPAVSHIKLRQYHLSFDNIWIASAFKGADGPIATFPNISNRFANHYNLMKTFNNYKFGGENEAYNFKGIILTGWSRYTHFEPLCELLTLSLPSLFMNLHVIHRFKNKFNNEFLEHDWLKMFWKYFYADIKNDLQCSFHIQNPSFTTCQFVTVNLYAVMSKFTHFNEYFMKQMYLDDQTVIPSLKYYTQKNMASKRSLKDKIQIYREVKTLLITLKQEMYYHLGKFYDKAFIDEYIGYKTFEISERLDEVLKILEKVVN